MSYTSSFQGQPLFVTLLSLLGRCFSFFTVHFSHLKRHGPFPIIFIFLSCFHIDLCVFSLVSMCCDIACDQICLLFLPAATFVVSWLIGLFPHYSLLSASLAKAPLTWKPSEMSESISPATTAQYIHSYSLKIFGSIKIVFYMKNSAFMIIKMSAKVF